MRAEALLQANSAAAVRRNILATQQLLEALPGSDVSLVLLSSHLAAQRQGVAGSSLAAAEALVAQWAASHPSCSVQVWRLPAAFDPQAITTAEASEPSAAWLRERLAEAFVDQLQSLGIPVLQVPSVNSLTVGLSAVGSTWATCSHRSRGAQRTLWLTRLCLMMWHHRLVPHWGQNSSSSHSLLSTNTG